MFSIEPINNVTVTGQSWLQPSEVLDLSVHCTGSPPFKHCFKFVAANHNVSANETCERWTEEATCAFRLHHYNPTTYKILLFVQNVVAQVIKEVTVNVYEAKTQSQLSVIVVPVAFSLVAVTLIIFGVAYYVQNRSR